MQGFRVHSLSQGRMMLPQKTVSGGGCYPGPETPDYNPSSVRKSPTPLSLGLSPKGTYRHVKSEVSTGLLTVDIQRCVVHDCFRKLRPFQLYSI